MGKGNSKVIVVIVGLVVLALVVFGGIFLTQNLGKSDREISAEQATSSIDQMAKKVNPKEGKPKKSSLEYTEAEVTAAELPALDDSSIATKATTQVYAEIYAPSNIAGSGSDAWMADMATQFNASGAKVNGQNVSIQVRNLPTGMAFDYIATGKEKPAAYCPSNALWVSMLQAKGVPTEIVRDSMVSDVAGILLDGEHKKQLEEKYGNVDMKSITEAVSSGELSFGYTNPFTSSTGMNFLISTLIRYDADNPLSDEAAKGFRDFQANVPLVSLTTQQMVKASQGGKFDGFVNEYQVYSKDPSLQSQYEFTPFGYKHDYPLVVCASNADDTQKQIVEQFAAFCDSNGADLAKQDGFNQITDYKPEMPDVDGKTLLAAEQFYKKNKDGDEPVIAVFVTDVSGSMSGEPIQGLKSSLTNGMKYINEDNYIGLVSYSDDVTIEIPISKFDNEHQQLFKGAVEGLKATGGTASYDALIVAADMINKEMENHPNAKPMIFLLTDGESNRGYTLNDVKAAIQGSKIPVYTIGYNANISALQSVSDINEAASINADTDDVVYQLKTLFNANM